MHSVVAEYPGNDSAEPEITAKNTTSERQVKHERIQQHNRKSPGTRTGLGRRDPAGKQLYSAAGERLPLYRGEIRPCQTRRLDEHSALQQGDRSLPGVQPGRQQRPLAGEPVSAYENGMEAVRVFRQHRHETERAGGTDELVTGVRQVRRVPCEDPHL